MGQLERRRCSDTPFAFKLSDDHEATISESFVVLTAVVATDSSGAVSFPGGKRSLYGNDCRTHHATAIKLVVLMLALIGGVDRMRRIDTTFRYSVREKDGTNRCL